ncbi:hypothetical protein MMC22_008284 [Lobaria immixta]|nr:hypothetical protein [Lobaria immixta]
MLSEEFYDYDDQSWKLLYKHPRAFAKDVLSAKAKIVRIVVAYFQLPKEDRSDASWIIQFLEAEQSKIGLDSYDIAGMMTAFRRDCVKDAQEFKLIRFLGVANAGLAKGKSYRPFGGGSTYCPGRFGAKQEVFMFVATVLARFDISTVATAIKDTKGLEKGRGVKEGQAFPRLDHKSRPSVSWRLLLGMTCTYKLHRL